MDITKTIDVEKLQWKTINHPEIKNMEISEYGHLRRIGSNVIRTGTIDNNGYRSVKLGMGKNQKTKKFLVHRLVALTFLPEINIEGLVVDHINEEKVSNHYSNLQWISKSENSAKSRRLSGRKAWQAPAFTAKEVRKCRKLYNNGMSIWNIWSLILNKKTNYATVLNMLNKKTYKDVI